VIFVNNVGQVPVGSLPTGRIISMSSARHPQDPERADELAEAFAVEFDWTSEPKLVERERPEDPEEAVLSASSTLINIVGEDSKIAQFSHFSVKDFLTSERFKDSEFKGSSIYSLYTSLGDAHTVLTQVYLAVLLRLDQNSNNERHKTSPLVRYAARHWVDHAKLGNITPELKRLMERLFNPEEPHLVAWTRIYDVDKGNEPSANDLDDNEERPTPAGATPLYYAALCGFAGVTKKLITFPQNVNAKCGHHGTPLHAASYEGHLESARLLLLHGADVKMMNAHKKTALWSAYASGHPDVMEILIRNGADVEEGYADLDSAHLLHIASRHGKADVVRLLLQQNHADVDARDNLNQTPLHEASTNGHLKVVELLLDHKADVNATTTAQNTPLHGASESGHLEVVQMLLKRGADMRMRNGGNGSPLEVARTSGHAEVAEFFAKHGAEK
jgi:ankyrin repeat protein